MRDLEVSDKNTLTLLDGMTGRPVTLIYRTPTTEERIAYDSQAIRFIGKKPVMVPEARLKFGAKILTGIAEPRSSTDADFGFSGRPLSSNPGSEYYRADWKDLLLATASDIIDALAVSVFAGTRIERGEDQPEGDDLPLPKSSGD